MNIKATIHRRAVIIIYNYTVYSKMEVGYNKNKEFIISVHKNEKNVLSSTWNKLFCSRNSSKLVFCC